MKKMSGFYLAQRKRVKDLTKEIEMIEVESQRKKLKKLVDQRKNKWKQVVGAQQEKLPKFNHIKKQYSEFAIVSPNSKGEHFLSEREKMKVCSTDRVYSSLPNMKLGKISIKQKSQLDDLGVKNQKFIEYDRITDQQSAIHKIAAQKLQQSLIIPRRQSKINLERSYFQKSITNKYSFNDSNNSLLSRSKTDRVMSQSLQLQKSRIGDSTLDSIRLSQDKLDNSRVRMQVKNRAKSPVPFRVSPLRDEKNVNCLQC